MHEHAFALKGEGGGAVGGVAAEFGFDRIEPFSGGRPGENGPQPRVGVCLDSDGDKSVE